MCIPYIYCWHNGLGNQLLTMINMLYYTFKFKKLRHIRLPANPVFTINSHENDSTDEMTCECTVEKDITRRINPCSDWFCLGVVELREMVAKHITYNFASDLKQAEYDIGIHIRSGDIFGGNVHWEYVQPPLDYYIQFIDRNPSKSIVIVHDTNERKPHWRNPVLDKLIAHISDNSLTNVTVQSKSVREDMWALCCSRNIVCAMGTFALMCHLISPFSQRIYIPHYMVNKCRGKNWFSRKPADEETVRVIDVSGYIKVGSWKNKPEQQQAMIDYTMKASEMGKFDVDI